MQAASAFLETGGRWVAPGAYVETSGLNGYPRSGAVAHLVRGTAVRAAHQRVTSGCCGLYHESPTSIGLEGSLSTTRSYTMADSAHPEETNSSQALPFHHKEKNMAALEASPIIKEVNQFKWNDKPQYEAYQRTLKLRANEIYRYRRAAGDSHENALKAASWTFTCTASIVSFGAGQLLVDCYCGNGVHLHFKGIHATPNAGACAGVGAGTFSVSPESLDGVQAMYSFVVTGAGWVAAAVDWGIDLENVGNCAFAGFGTPTGPIPGLGAGTFTRVS